MVVIGTEKKGTYHYHNSGSKRSSQGTTPNQQHKLKNPLHTGRKHRNGTTKTKQQAIVNTYSSLSVMHTPEEQKLIVALHFNRVYGDTLNRSKTVKITHRIKGQPFETKYWTWKTGNMCFLESPELIKKFMRRRCWYSNSRHRVPIFTQRFCGSNTASPKQRPTNLCEDSNWWMVGPKVETARQNLHKIWKVLYGRYVGSGRDRKMFSAKIWHEFIWLDNSFNNWPCWESPITNMPSIIRTENYITIQIVSSGLALLVELWRKPNSRWGERSKTKSP